MIIFSKHWVEMGGYANYIWSSYAAGLFMICSNIWYSHRLQKKTVALIENIKRMQDE